MYLNVNKKFLKLGFSVALHIDSPLKTRIPFNLFMGMELKSKDNFRYLGAHRFQYLQSLEYLFFYKQCGNVVQAGHWMSSEGMKKLY